MGEGTYTQRLTTSDPWVNGTRSRCPHCGGFVAIDTHGRWVTNMNEACTNANGHQPAEVSKMIYLGKIAYTSDRKINAVEIKIEISGRRLSMVGFIWNGNRSDTVAVGQIYKEIERLFPRNRKVQRMVAIWHRWHLNDMRPGDAAQMAYLRRKGLTETPYEGSVRALDAAGLLVHNGYRYGTAWKSERLPQRVINEIATW